MITSKYIHIITAVTLCLSLIACGLMVYAANTFDAYNVPAYQVKMFGDEILALEILVDQDDWQNLLENAQAKAWISADVIINGERFSAVGIRTKGNSSLSSGVRSDTGRYSLQFNMNKYVKGQTYYGLDTFCVNNMMGDATYMKDYFAYEIMDFSGVATPLKNYASVTVNGEAYAFGLVLERYDRAFLGRVFNTSAGQLYNVKINMGMRSDFENLWQDVPSSAQIRPAGGAIGLGGFGGGGGGGSLVYTDDSTSSYAAIFDNAVFSNASDKDKQRVITAIASLNAGANLETYFDVDAILRYFAAHTVVVNLDSYVSNMAQNYYIYERDGKITILPWDYGLAFGGFQSGDASGVVNYPIDSPVSGVSMEERPLLNMLLQVDEYRDTYHDYLRQLVEGYFESGLFEETIINLDAKIGEFIRNDVSAYYTYEQYQDALPHLVQLGNLRAESIKGQLEGLIPSTSSGQSADRSALVDASSVNLSAMGSMGGGMGGFGDRAVGGGIQQPGGGQGWPDGVGGVGGSMPDMVLMQQALQILADAGGDLTEEVVAALTELGLTQEQIEQMAGLPDQLPSGNMVPGAFPGMAGPGVAPGDDRGRGAPRNPAGGNNVPPGSISNPGQPGAQAQSEVRRVSILTLVSSLTLLLGATVVVARPRRSQV